MPWPIGLVVKNGSKARAMTSGVMPVPVSVTRDADILAGLARRAGRRSRASRSALQVSIVSVPPSGMASRALMARLRIAFSSWFWSHSVGQRSAGERQLELDALAQRAAQQVLHDAISGLTSSGLGSSGWRREKASRRCVSAAARLADVTAPLTKRSSSLEPPVGDAASAPGRGSRRCPAADC